MKSIVVLYHKDCLDGFSAAWAAYKKFNGKAKYIGVEHRSIPPKLENKEIYFVDFCYKEPEMKKLLEKNQKVVVIDHHQSQKSLIKKLISEHSYDLNHSGAVLTWKYFHPGKPVPKLLLYIEDNDLWKFKLGKTREIISVLALYDFNFSVWNKLEKDLENAKKRQKYIGDGKLLLKYQAKIIADIAKKAYRVVFKKHRSLAVNSSSSLLHSELGNALVKKGYPIGIVWYQIKNRIKVSLRSDGKTDVAKLAEKYGGGGHKAAAGFSFKVGKKFPWKQI
ncbi:MAG: hypothetical protein A3H02_01700 [Candidatus Niyogibacteria bacterium RIFCSPLOWO2_12_FULL_41_13]|uniref:DHHA1 domain-containing protein n=1 Tax=Candidatus Niyogibacteria bacterium RIFCSPLOWO2_12_FULL_41_13 TaxID=1801726 RepID=A0A1G2F287_9BACT|nr:MAG: hypothetical protein A3H02_01700 [Candidatus Niyogibacteria bacterium RIFCSPLOWO2_12_FULL_41_13]